MIGTRVSAGASYWEAKVVLAALGFLCFAVLLVCDFIWSIGGTAVLSGGTLLFALLLGLACRSVARRRVWVTAFEDRFIHEAAAGSREVQYAAVRGLLAFQRTNYKEGMPDSVTFTCKAWVEDGAPPLEMLRMVKLQQQDPVIFIQDRLVSVVLAGARTAFDRGEPVTGEGWALSKQGFDALQHGGTQRLSLDELAAVDEVDGHVCVWRKNQPEPVARVPVDTRNAFALTPLLRIVLEARPEKAAEVPPADGLGRVIFERQGAAWGWVALGAAFLGVGAAMHGGSPEGALVCYALGLVFFPIWWFRRNPSFRCCEYGVCRRYGNTEIQIRYLDVEAFTYQATRHYHNGAYTGTAYAFKFEPRTGKTIDYSCHIQETDNAMENLREHISMVIAGRMARELREGKEVPWTANLRFVGDGLDCKPRGLLFGRKEAFHLRLHEIDYFQMDAGVFKLYANGGAKPVMDEPVSVRNFFPGLALLEYLRAQLQQQAAAPKA